MRKWNQSPTERIKGRHRSQDYHPKIVVVLLVVRSKTGGKIEKESTDMGSTGRR
jgi:hypothetical protein